jgi:hypothetical protein
MTRETDRARDSLIYGELCAMLLLYPFFWSWTIEKNMYSKYMLNLLLQFYWYPFILTHDSRYVAVHFKHVAPESIYEHSN